jgi:hypothetical protein
MNPVMINEGMNCGFRKLLKYFNESAYELDTLNMGLGVGLSSLR